MYKQNPLVIVDGSYFLYRSFHGMPPMTNIHGLDTGAILGTVKSVDKLMRRITPTHMAVVFDSGLPSFRHELSPLYKAQRPQPPMVLIEQIPHLINYLTALGILVVQKDRVEGDDIIGTLTRIATDARMDVVISTGDKDMTQLIDHNVRIYDVFKDVMWDKKNIRERMGVQAHQVRDLLTLVGDAVDGIQGVPGCGAKTAARLLMQYGDLDTIIANLDHIPGKIQTNIRDNLENIKLDKVLTTIVQSLDLGIYIEDMQIGKPDWYQLDELRHFLEFDSI